MAKSTQIQLELRLEDKKALERVRSFGQKIQHATAFASNSMRLQSALRKDLKTPINELKWLSGHMGSLGNKLSSAVSLPLVAAAGGALHFASSFERIMARVQSLSGASAADLESLKQNAYAVAATSKFSARDMAKAQETLAVSGYNPSQISKSLGIGTAFATAMDVAVPEALDQLSSVASMFSFQKADITKPATLMAKGAAISSQTQGDQFDALRYFGSVADSSLSGSPLKESLAAIGVLADAGRKGGTAGIILRNLVSELQNVEESPKNMEILLDKYNIKFADLFILDDFGNQKLKPLADVLRHLSRLKSQDAIKIFGKQFGYDILKLAKSRSLFAEKLKILSEEERRPTEQTALENLQKSDMTGLSGAFESLKSTLETTAIQFATKSGLFDLVQRLVEKLTYLLDAFAKLDGWFPLMAKVGMGLVAAIAGIKLFATAAAGLSALLAGKGLVALGAAKISGMGLIKALGAGLGLAGAAAAIPESLKEALGAFFSTPEAIEAELTKEFLPAKKEPGSKELPPKISLDLKLDLPEGLKVSSLKERAHGAHVRFNLNLGQYLEALA